MPLDMLTGFFGAGGASQGYQIARSLRFNSADSANLSRTFGAAPVTRTKGTLSLWFKRANLSSGTLQCFMQSYDGTSSVGCLVALSTTDQIEINYGGSTNYQLITTRVLRDVAAWYHLVVAFDTTQGTSSNRMKVWLNGVQETAFGTANYPPSSANHQFMFNNGNNRLGTNFNASGNFFDGYMADVHWIDGTAYAASDFGQTDPTTGQWVPKQATGLTYGANGFYLPFSDNSGTTSTTLGKDAAGSNNWTPNNFSVTAGVGNDSLSDTPTANFPTMNPLSKGGNITLANGNLQITTAASSGFSIATFVFPTTGKWYWEYTLASGEGIVGISVDGSTGNYVGQSASGYGYYNTNGNKYNAGSGSAYGSTWTTNDVIGIAFDADAGKLYFSKNGTFQNSGDPVAGTGAAFTGLTANTYVPSCGTNTVGSGYANFGQRAFTTSPPAGFKALCAANLPDPAILKPNQYMDVSLWTGNGSNPRTLSTGVAFAPDLVWVKARNNGVSHAVQDAVRGFGVSTTLQSNTSSAEGASTDGGVTSVASGSLTLNAGGGGSANVNNSTVTYAAWQWKEGVTPGFDIVTYTGDGAANRNIAHSLGVAPEFIIQKRRDTGSTNWSVWHKGLTGEAYSIFLELTNAQTNSNSPWGSNSISSSTFHVAANTGGHSNANTGTYVVYLWAGVAGFSKFGSYTGNGSADGVFVNLGFRPKFIIYKRTDSAADWRIYDTSRNAGNLSDLILQPNLSNAETTEGIDILSNGFKLRVTTVGANGSGATFIYAAFAEAPFKYANAR